MKKIFLLCILILSLNATGLSRFVSVEEYENFSYKAKESYIRGSIDMLWVQLKNRYGNENKMSTCMDKINKINNFVDIYDYFLNKNGNQYNSYSASEILVLSLVEHCKK